MLWKSVPFFVSCPLFRWRWRTSCVFWLEGCRPALHARNASSLMTGATSSYTWQVIKGQIHPQIHSLYSYLTSIRCSLRGAILWLKHCNVFSVCTHFSYSVYNSAHDSWFQQPTEKSYKHTPYGVKVYVKRAFSFGGKGTCVTIGTEFCVLSLLSVFGAPNCWCCCSQLHLKCSILTWLPVVCVWLVLYGDEKKFHKKVSWPRREDQKGNR